jgi:hypothetical protein
MAVTSDVEIYFLKHCEVFTGSLNIILHVLES